MKKFITLSIPAFIFILGCAEENLHEIKKNTQGSKTHNPELTEARADFLDTSNFVQKFKERFKDYITLQPQVLAELVSIIPTQSTSWGCGLHQSAAAIETAYINAKQKRKNKTNFCEVCDYPLAVDININMPAIQNILNWAPAEAKKLKDASDLEGNFRVGALPHDLASYINKNLPKNSKFKAQAISLSELSDSELLKVVKHNLNLKLPTPVFYVIDKAKYKMHVYLIVGFKNNKLLVLDTSKEGIERLLTINTNDFVSNMNAQPIIQLVLQVSKFGPLFAGVDLKLADEATIKLWKPYSLIKFVPES